MANVELDFQILDPDAEGLQMNVLLVAAKRELVDSRTLLLGRLGSSGDHRLDAFAIHTRSTESSRRDAGGGGSSTSGTKSQRDILEDGVPVLTRDLSVAPALPEDCSARGPLRRGLRAGHPGQAQSGDLAQYVDARGEEIAVGVERAAAFLATASRSAGGWGVYTIGGGARVPGLNEALSNRLHVPVELASRCTAQGARLVFESVAVMRWLPC